MCADAAEAALAAHVAALAGGLYSADSFHQPGFFDAARECLSRYAGAKDPEEADLRQKACLANWMRKQGATPYAIAFMRYASAPAAISAVRVYGPVSVVRAAMLWADASEGWTIVGRSGDIVPLWTPPDLDSDSAFHKFRAAHADASLWPAALTWPRVVARSDGGRELDFNFAVKTCHACADLGIATIGYVFSADGDFVAMHLIRIVSEPAPAQQ